MKPRIEITKDEPRPGYFTCEVKVGAGTWEHTAFLKGVNNVLDWLEAQGIAPEPENDDSTRN